MSCSIPRRDETVPALTGFETVGDGKEMVSLMCKDIGMDCPFEATGTTDQEIMRQFIDHAESAHKMSVLPADIIYRVQKSIKK